jgi:predicted transposase/invertase (TIGR01784 family)
MRPTPVFGDPKTDFVFQRIFGSEDHMTALIGFLNDVLELDDAHRVVSVIVLPPEQRPKVSELKYSIVDVKCVDARGTTYVVEMQVFNVEAFEKRVVYNVAKAYTNRLGVGVAYPELDDVIGISICDFELWPHGEAPHVPMLSRWRMQEQQSGVRGLPQLQFVFMELPKYTGGNDPQTFVDKWAYFFREAENLLAIPEALRHPPLLDALGRVGRLHRGGHGDPERARRAFARAQGGHGRRPSSSDSGASCSARHLRDERGPGPHRGVQGRGDARPLDCQRGQRGLRRGCHPSSQLLTSRARTGGAAEAAPEAPASPTTPVPEVKYLEIPGV